MILIIDIGYDQIYHLTEAVDLFDDYKVIPVLDLEKHKLDELSPDGIIISHGSILPDSSISDQFVESLRCIESTSVPVLAIGSGHHLLGKLFGAETTQLSYLNDTVTVGIIEIEDPLFYRLADEIELTEDRASTIGIPPNFMLLASSDSCINEAMKHREKPIYSVQFILERSGDLGAIIIENFVNISRG